MRSVPVALVVATMALTGCLRDELSPIKSAPRADAALGDAQGDARPGDGGSDSKTPSVCRSSDDCPEAWACELGTGCVQQRCGLPNSPEGQQPQTAKCNEDINHCAAGLVCVSTQLWSRDGALQLGVEGSCLLACDPCAPACPAHATCIQLPTSGGYCAQDGLAAEGKLCAGRGCQGTMSCEHTCQRACLPVGPVAIDSASTSNDCLVGEVCVQGADLALSGDKLLCKAGQVVAAGYSCASAQGVYCAAPSRCDDVLQLCAPTEDCAMASDVCPENSHCSTLSRLGSTMVLCVGDATVPFGGICGDDVNCAEGLVCAASHPQKPEEKRCMYPGG